jgi:predicted phage terminase large subunit-like protein
MSFIQQENTFIDPDLCDLLAACHGSSKLIAEIFMSKDTFTRPFDPPHLQMFDILDDPCIRRKLIVAPRGIGKTTIVSKPFLIRHILFQNKRHIVYVSKTNTHALNQTENLKWELMTNPYFSRIFGSIKSDNFSKDEWITSSGVKVVPRGAGQQIRGLLFRQWRPDLIVIDDLEDPELVLNEDHRAKLWDWFHADVMNSLAVDGEIVIIGSLLHEKSLLARLLTLTSQWKTLKLRIWDEQHVSLFPNYKSTEEIRKIFEEHRETGSLDLFARELCGDVISKENARFQQSMFKYYNEDPSNQLDSNPYMNPAVENVILMDVAKTLGNKADFTAIVGVGINTETARIFVRDIVNSRLHPDEAFETAYQMARRLRTHVYGFEVTSLNEYITQPFANFMRLKGSPYELVELHAVKKKELRIQALVPYYRQGYILHNDNGCCEYLEDQLLRFPRGAHDDIIDAFSYIIRMMEEGGRFFIPTNLTTEQKKNQEEAIQELEEFHDMEPIEDEEWQFV